MSDRDRVRDPISHRPWRHVVDEQATAREADAARRVGDSNLASVSTARGVRVVGAAVLVVGLVAAGAGVSAAGPVARPRYVALGDSFTAGPLIPGRAPGPPGCLRSSRNYPRLVAKALGADLRDESCSGATTAALVAPQRLGRGANRPQLDALDAGTGIVTLGISGNDIGFGAILGACAAAVPLGRPCQDRFVGPRGDEIARRIAEAGARVAAILAEVARRAPSARVFLVGYPAILPEHDLGCFPLLPIAFADVSYLRDKQKELNAMLESRAAAVGVGYVDIYRPSVGHDACSLPGIRWVEPVVPLAPAAPVHPNAKGMRGMAAEVVRAIRR